MGLHRRLAEVQPPADLGRAETVGEQHENVVLARGQPGRLRARAPHERLCQPEQRNERGETAACFAAFTTSVDGASLPTNADAPASIAAKIWSSPACMVSTTMPVSLRSRRTDPDHVEPGAVLQLQVGDDDVGLELVVHRERLGDRLGSTDHLGCRLGGEDHGEALTDQVVVVHEQHPVGRRLVHTVTLSSSRRSSSVLAAGPGRRTVSTVPCGTPSVMAVLPPPGVRARA